MTKLRILIVDDTDTWRMLMAQYMRPMKEIEIAGQAQNAAETLKKCRELSPDVVLLDISLPDGKGVDVARQIKELNPSIKVYLCSAYELGEIRELALNSPVDGFIQKSSLKAELQQVLRAEIERHNSTPHS